MKKLSVAMVAMVVMALGAHADTVTSVNVVGYVTAEQAKGTFELMAIDFDQFEGTNVIGDVLDAASLPSGTIALLWDAAGQEYGATETVITFPETRWDPGTNTVDRGDAFWLKMPASAGDTNLVSTVGEVPDYETGVVLVPGFSFVSYPYPASVEIGSAEIPAKSGDAVLWWDGAGWQSETYVTFPTTKWDPGTYVLEIGKGFLYKSGASTNKMWTPSVPY